MIFESLPQLDWDFYQEGFRSRIWVGDAKTALNGASF
jgi:hypothetical protein